MNSEHLYFSFSFISFSVRVFFYFNRNIFKKRRKKCGEKLISIPKDMIDGIFFDFYLSECLIQLYEEKNYDEY